MLVFLFTDIEGSTQLWEEHTDEMGAVIARHDAILQEQIEASGGILTKHTGDGITAAFEGGEPVACALEAQTRFSREPWGSIGELRIRVGLHAGQAQWISATEPHTGDYHGPPVNCTARIMSAAWGGQILLTPEVTQASPLPLHATLLDLGEHLLKNVSAPQKILQLLHPDLRQQQFPPPRTLSGESIRQVVDEGGARLAALEPQSMAIALVGASLLPALQGELDPESGALEGNLGVLEELGAASLRGFVAEFADRLRKEERPPTHEIESLLMRDLEVRWQAGGKTAVALRADASRLLQAVHGVETAMRASTGEVKEAIARGLADLGSQFGEFRWMLAGIQDTLAEMKAEHQLQLSLQREQLAKTDELLQLQREQARVTPVTTQPLVPAEPPAFLADEVEPFQQPVFVARGRELARLDTLLQESQIGNGKVVFVAGGPGRGKTALLNEFARRAMDTNPELLVASGGCNAFSGVGDPYLPFREVIAMLSGDVEARWLAGQITRQHAQRLWAALPLLAQALLARGPDVLGVFVQAEGLLARATTIAGTDAPWLGALRDAVERRQALPPGAATQGVEQSHLFEQYTNVLRKLGESHPLLLILDDVQWADATSVGLLFHLGRRLEGVPILIIGAYRPEEVALGRGGERHPLEKVLAEFKLSFGDVWLDLAREDKAEGRGFIDELLDTEPNNLEEGFRQALSDHTGGHPLFAIELLRDLQERGDVVRNEQGRWVEGPALSWESLPARVEGVIEERIGRLDEDLREALTVASVEGEEFTAEVVARVQEVQERHLLRQLSRELEKRHRLVRERGEDRVGRLLLSRYRFAHHLFQRYLYNDLSAGERRLLHGEIAGVVEEMFEGRTEEVAVQLAFHFGRAELGDRALPYLVQAGHQAQVRYANEQAIDFFRRALVLLDADPPERCRDSRQLKTAAQLREDQGDVLELIGRHDEARDAYREARASLPEQDRIWQSRLYRKTGETWQAQQSFEHAARAYDLAESTLGRGQARSNLDWWRAWIQVQVDRIWMHYWQRQLARMAELTEQVQPAVEQYGTPVQRAWFFQALVVTAWDRERHRPSEETLALARTMLAASLEAGDAGIIGMSQFMLGYACLWRDELEEAEDALRGSLVLAERIGDVVLESRCLTYLTVLSRRHGEVEGARHYISRSLPVAQSAQVPMYVGAAQANLAWVAWRRDDFSEAKANGQAALDTWKPIGAFPFKWTALWPLTGVALARQEVDRAMTYTRKMLDPLQQLLPGEMASALEAAIQAWDQGQAEDAETHLRHAAETAVDLGYL